MKLKYYLRGLGIGVVVTALIMGFVKGGSKEKLSDAEIMARAEQLGMVHSSVLSTDLGKDEPVSANEVAQVTVQEQKEPIESVEPEKTDEPETQAVEKDTENATSVEAKDDKNKDDKNKDDKKPSTNAVDEKTADDKETGDDESDKDSKSEKGKADNKEQSTQSTYVVTINRGEGSDTVARRMEKMGIIKDASAFDKFLCQNGYDKKLTVGNHLISANASNKEMAEALTKSSK